MIEVDEADFFEENAISEQEAWNACERFVALRSDDYRAFMQFQGHDTDELLSLDQVLHHLAESLEAGFIVRY